MFTFSAARQEQWDGFNLLHLQLKYAELQCPYDLPAERKKLRSHKEGSSWLSSLLTGGKNTSSKKSDDKTFKTVQNVMAIKEDEQEGDEKEKKMSKNALVVPLRSQENRVESSPTYSVTSPDEKTMSSSGTTTTTTNNNNNNNNSCNEASIAQHVVPTHYESEEENDNHSMGEEYHEHTCIDKKNKIDTDHAGSLVCNRTAVQPRSVAVGTEELDSSHIDKGSVVLGKGKDGEKNLPLEENNMENLLLGAVERLYTKIEGTALKVVGLDELNQKLLEAFPQPQKSGRAVEEDRAELAIHLYSLRHQVELLKSKWNEYETARRTSESRRAHEKKTASKTIRVEIVRAYEDPPLPYKKGPFIPLSHVHKPPHPLTETTSRSSTYTRSTRSSSSSVFSSMRTVDSSYDSSPHSEEEYSDDFEDE